MDRKETGGQAFPSKVLDHNIADGHGGIKPIYDYITGMTLRDYFAGQMCGEIIEYFIKNESVLTFEEMAKISYEISDAMLKERNK